MSGFVEDFTDQPPNLGVSIYDTTADLPSNANGGDHGVVAGQLYTYSARFSAWYPDGDIMEKGYGSWLISYFQGTAPTIVNDFSTKPDSMAEGYS